MSRYTDDAYMANVRRTCELFASMRTPDGGIDLEIAKRALPEIHATMAAMEGDRRCIRSKDVPEIEAAIKIANIVRDSAETDAEWYRQIIAAQPGSYSS